MRESANALVVVARAEVVLIQVRVVLFAGIEVVVVGESGTVQEVAEGFVVVGIGDGLRVIGQRTGAAQSVVVVVERARGALLADQVVAVGVVDVPAGAGDGESGFFRLANYSTNGAFVNFDTAQGEYL